MTATAAPRTVRAVTSAAVTAASARWSSQATARAARTWVAVMAEEA
ncbi:hypothetical protein [Streptomyces sp. NPDC058614]